MIRGKALSTSLLLVWTFLPPSFLSARNYLDNFGGHLHPFRNDPNIRILNDIQYGTDPSRQVLDAYLLRSLKPTPVLIHIHGGGWNAGQKSEFHGTEKLFEAIKKAGISAVSITYRYTEEHPFPAQMEDVARAVQFVRHNSKEWNIDPDRIAAFGGSAGGNLAAWLAMHDDLVDPDSKDPVSRQSTRLTCYIVTQAPVDLTRIRPVSLMKTGGAVPKEYANVFTKALGVKAPDYNVTYESKKLIEFSSPLAHLTKDDPPAMLIFWGTKEMAGKDHRPVPAILNNPHDGWYGVLLADRLRTLDIEFVNLIGPEGGKPERHVREIVKFLVKHLKRTSDFGSD